LTVEHIHSSNELKSGGTRDFGKKRGRRAQHQGLPEVRIPDDADQRSGMMPITIPF
jgi:hypothetical protein